VSGFAIARVAEDHAVGIEGVAIATRAWIRLHG
jgi:hypothetical protein